MNTEKQFIEAVKELEKNKKDAWDYVSTVFLFLSILMPSEYNIPKARKDFTNTFNIQRTLPMPSMEGITKIRSFIGNEIYNSYQIFLSYVMRINFKAYSGFKINNIEDWRLDTALQEILPEKYYSIITQKQDFNKINTSPLYLIKEALEHDLAEQISNKLNSFKSDPYFNVSGENILIGNQSMIGNNNKILSDNKISIKESVKNFANEHPFFFWLQILIDIGAVFLTLVQMKWINL